MADADQLRHEPADGFIRDRRAARRRGDDDEGLVPVARHVTVYHAADCSLCERALEIVEELHVELGFELDVVDIGGRPELESRYREQLPVVEIDGERAFTYFVDRDALRSKLRDRP